MIRVLLSLLIVAATPADGEQGTATLAVEEPASAPVAPVTINEQDQDPLPAPSKGRRQADAVEVFHSGFEEAADDDYDQWPDGWKRRSGPGFPRYLSIKIVEQPSSEGSRALRLTLNGGAATIYSPPIDVAEMFSYVLEGDLKTDSLINDRAFFSVTFYDAQSKPLETFYSQRVGRVADWKHVRLGPMTPQSDNVRSAVIGLHLEPTKEADLKGWAMFDDVWLGQLPRMTLKLNSPHHVYVDSSQIEATCRVAGIAEQQPSLHFELLDIAGQCVATDDTRLKGEQIVAKPGLGAGLRTSAIASNVFAGAAHWKPKVTQPGFYRLQVAMQGSAGLIFSQEVTLAVIEPQPQSRGGEFGWSLPHSGEPLSLGALGDLLPQMGLSWLKFPVWSSEKQPGRLDQLVAFAERLSKQGVETVGLLVDPPAEVASQLGDQPLLQGADIFSTETELWYPPLEPVMTRLALQIRWWQLGFDDDISFVGYPDLIPTIAGVKKQLQRFGQEVHLGIGWRVLNEVPDDKQPPWEFLALSANPPLSEAELAAYLPAIDSAKARRWVSVQPMSRKQYPLEVRANDLVRRMLAAKMQGAEGIFVSNPLNSDNGVLNDDGTPGELLMPWRTAALALGGAEYLGSLALPRGSQNHLFARGGQVVMIVWNDTPVEETLYLGEDVRETDIWGRTNEPLREQNQQIIRVGRTPKFITGVSEPIARCNLAIRFEKTQLPSVFGVPHENSISVKNFFGQGVGGRMRIVTPDAWKTFPRIQEFKLAAGEDAALPFTITLPLDASSGRQSVRVEFDINLDRHYQFSVYRYLDVGLGDVTLDVVTHLNEQGELQVEQHMINHRDEYVSFKCLLFAVDRPRLVSQVVRLGKDRDTKIYRFPNGKALIGKTLMIRAEEIGGDRTLNHRFVAQE